MRCFLLVSLLLALSRAGSVEIRGMTFTGDRYCKEVRMDSDVAMASLEHLASTGCNYVAIVVTWYQETFQSSRIYPINRPFETHASVPGMWNYTFVSETPRAVVAAIRRAHALDMRVLLKPHVDLVNDEGGLW